MRGSDRLAALAASVLIALCSISSAQEIEPETPHTLEQAHEEFLANSDMQTERPVNADPDSPERRRNNDTPGWLEAISRFLGSVFTALGPIFSIAFYLMLGALVVTILYFLFGETLRARFGDGSKTKTRQEDDLLEEFRPDAQAARSLLAEADALAKEGRFAEAVHLLLFRSIQDIQMKRGEGVPPSLTAREIGGLSGLPNAARNALSPIISLVERSFFGGRPVDEAGWRSARDSYEAFAFGESWA